MYVYHTYLLALRYEVVDSLLGSLAGRTHEDDDVLGVLSSVVVEAVIFTACDFCHLLTIFLYYVRNSVIV